jgi:FkbM family methyltransferase
LTLRPAGIYEFARSRLLRLGPHHPILRAAFRAQARLLGFRVALGAGRITLARSNQRVILAERDYPSVPSVVHTWSHLFATTVAKEQDGLLILDFSRPALHTFRRSGISFHFPGLIEEDAADFYTSAYTPQPGDIVWDLGANAGATTYHFSRMVGDRGSVYAFEPDALNFEFLLRNIELHALSNVVPVAVAVAGRSGRQLFSMDGTVGAGLVGLSQCSDPDQIREVETLSFADACHRYGVPRFVKMDIEGAELEVIQSALETLKRETIHLAIETEHRVNGEFTSRPIGQMLREMGYQVSSASPGGEEITWACPPGSGAR